MKQFQGRLADGTFHSFEALEEQSKREASLLESLRGSMSLMRTGFLDFGLNQESMCKQYESGAHVSVNNNVEIDVVFQIRILRLVTMLMQHLVSQLPKPRYNFFFLNLCPFLYVNFFFYAFFVLLHICELLRFFM